jgi:hypothetical protein
MPLLDHFHPPLSEERHWEGFHSKWANCLVDALNERLLPPGYFAEPNIHLPDTFEVRVFNAKAGRTRVASMRRSTPRPIWRAEKDEVDAWLLPLAIGDPLPQIPLALTAELCLPVPLETTYIDACRKLRLA